MEHAKREDHKRCKQTAQGLLFALSYRVGRLTDMMNDKCPALENVNEIDISVINTAIARIRQAVATAQEKK